MQEQGYEKVPKLINRLENLQLIAVRKVRKCLYPGCEKNTVKNHCVSQALMHTFGNEGHVRHLVVDPWIPGALAFKRVGINNATVFHGLCNNHDHKIFEPIDTPAIEINSYKSQILLSFRSLLHEKLKKTAKKESYSKLSSEHSNIDNQGLHLAELHGEQFIYNLLSVGWYERQFLNEIRTPGNKFVFKILEFPFFEVAGSELFSFEPDDITHLKRANYKRFGVLDPFADLFLHMVPCKGENKLYVILGAHSKDKFALNHFYKYLKGLPTLKALSDILFLYVEDWVCSEDFFSNYLGGNEKELVRIFYETGGRSVTARSTNFNLFNLSNQLFNRNSY